MSTKYTVGIIHYKDPDAIRELLVSMQSWNILPQQIIIADNSMDLREEVLASGPIGTSIRILGMKQNVGYGAAANRILQELAKDDDYCLIMTQDARLEACATKSMLEVLASDAAIAATVPLLLYASRPGFIFSGGGTVSARGRTLHPQQGERYRSNAWSSRAPYEVDWGDGACLLLRVDSVKKAGYFDEKYFLYVEEVDLQYRLKNVGFKIVLVPEALGYQEPGPYSLYYKYRNLPYFTRKHSEKLKPWPWFFALPKDTLRMLRKGRISEPFWALRGLLDGRLGRFGPQPAGLAGRRASVQSPAKNILIVVESEPELSPPGISRRYQHVMVWARNNDIDCRTVVLSGDSGAPASKLRRVLRAWTASKRVKGFARDSDQVLVLGLGAAHLLFLAAALNPRVRRVVYDACDSWILQLRSRLSSRTVTLAIPTVTGIVLQATLSRRLEMAYITTSDLRADRLLNWGSRRAFVIPVAAPPVLSELTPMGEGTAERIVVSADYDGFHNRQLIAALLEAWPSVTDRVPAATLHLYGRGYPPEARLPGVVGRGWAEDIRDIYAGRSVAFITNKNGSGFPNKLAEAIAAQRPVILHSSFARLVNPHKWIYLFDSDADLVPTIVQALSTHYSYSADMPMTLRT